MKSANRIDKRRFLDSADLIVRTNMDGLITYMSTSAERLTGYKRDAFMGRAVSELVGVATAARLSEAVRDRSRYPERPIAGVEYSFIHKRGHTVWFEARPSLLIDAITGRQIGVTDVVRDITESRAVREALEFSNVLLKVQMEASPSAILVVNAELRIVSYNQKFCQMWNVPPSHLVGHENETLLAAISAQINDGKGLPGQIEWLLANPDKERRAEVETKDGRCIEACSVPMRSEGRGNLGRAYFFQDVTQSKRALAHALYRARFDTLTGLANREVFFETVNTAIATAKRGGGGFAVVFLDLDRFKSVNDTLGHPVGDELLKQVAARLKGNLREVDLVARFGGDEFAILISNAETSAMVGALAAKLVSVLAASFHIQDRVVCSGASLGIEMYGPHAPDVETLLLHADIALYRVKADNRGSYRFFTEHLGAETSAPIPTAADSMERLASSPAARSRPTAAVMQ